MVARRQSILGYDPSREKYTRYPHYAYHLNLHRFNTFLRELCRERGVELVDDVIADVAVDGDRVAGLEGVADSYEADLYVDATGFGRLLKRAVGGDFRTFDLPLDTAFQVSQDRPLSEVIPATVIDSGDHGWFWNIDTYDNRDRGYVFASEYVDEEEALAEFVAHVDGDVDPRSVQQYRFTSGYFRDAWAGNLVTIGNAGGFVEPIQSTALTANAEAAYELSRVLSHHGCNSPEARRCYNDWYRRCWESIHDFVAIHYRFAGGETAFWQDMADLELSDRAERIVESYHRSGFAITASAVADREIRDIEIFPTSAYFSMLRNMGVRSERYDAREGEVPRDVRRAVRDRFDRWQERGENLLTVEEAYTGIPALREG